DLHVVPGAEELGIAHVGAQLPGRAAGPGGGPQRDVCVAGAVAEGVHPVQVVGGEGDAVERAALGDQLRLQEPGRAGGGYQVEVDVLTVGALRHPDRGTRIE